MIDLNITKTHMKVDYSDDDSYISILIAAATAYVTELTKVVNDANSPKSYDIAVLLLVSHMYANREIVTDKSSVVIPHGFAMWLASIKEPESFI